MRFWERVLDLNGLNALLVQSNSAFLCACESLDLLFFPKTPTDTFFTRFESRA